MTSRILALFFLSLTIFISGCGGHAQCPASTSVTLTSAQVFTPTIGQTWTFRNGYGDLTYITQQAATPSNYLPAGSINFVYQKNSCRAYWAAGICDALLHFVLVPQPDGSWTSPASLFYFPTQLPDYMNGNHMQTSNFVQVPGMPIPYTIIPASATTGTTVSVPTQYDRYDAPNSYTFDSIVSGAPAARVDWKTTSYIENVSTPVYSGPALVSEQFEAACIHEKWYFAPGFGLVKVIPLDNGSCTPGDPNLTMVRVLN